MAGLLSEECFIILWIAPYGKKENLIFMWKDGGLLAGKNQTKQKIHEFPASVENSYPPEEKNK
jgi:hypothetical protein